METNRLASGIDTAWLQLEQDTNRMVIHGILFCDGPVDLELLRERVAARWIPVYPGLRQRPSWSPGELGPVQWVDAEPDLTVHIRGQALAAPGDDAALARHVGAMMAQPLPADRPWWAMRVLSGYARRGTAIVVAIHHGLADGVALNHLFHALSDDPPGVEDGAHVAYAAEPERRPGLGDVRVLREELPGRARDLWGKLRRGVTHGEVGELGATMKAIRSSAALLARPPVDASTALQGRLGVEKSARWTSAVDLAAVKALGREHGASVNDVLCAAVAGALREYLGAGAPGTDVPRLRAVVPTNLRPLDAAISARLGNEVGLVLPPLPTDEPDPVRRIERMHRTMSTIKRTNQALATFAGIAGAGHARPTFTRGMVRRYASTSSLVITNVPGPVTALTLAGTTVRDVLFWVPCTGKLALGVSILSYAGSVRLGVAADTAILGGEEGVDRFTAALDAALRASAPAGEPEPAGT